jgi:hypothetical protein
VVVGFRFTRTRFFLERVLSAVLCDVKGVSSGLPISSCELGSQLGFHRDVGFFIITFGFYLRDLLSIPMGSAPVDAGVVLS